MPSRERAACREAEVRLLCTLLANDDTSLADFDSFPSKSAVFAETIALILPR